jgi:hypothetical protein
MARIVATARPPSRHPSRIVTHPASIRLKNRAAPPITETMHPRWLRALLVLAIASATACSRFTLLTALQPAYHGSVRVVVPHEKTLHATRRALAALGWTVVDSRSRDGRVVATRNVTAESRDVAVVDVGSDGSLEIWVRTEIAGDGGRWIRPAGVCDGYTYSREREIAARIEIAARRIERRMRRSVSMATVTNARSGR